MRGFPHLHSWFLRFFSFWFFFDDLSLLHANLFKAMKVIIVTREDKELGLNKKKKKNLYNHCYSLIKEEENVKTTIISRVLNWRLLGTAMYEYGRDMALHYVSCVEIMSHLENSTYRRTDMDWTYTNRRINGLTGRQLYVL